MSFLHLKNKTEPKYTEPRTATIHKDVFDTKPKPEKKIIENSKSSLMIGEGGTITGTIKANNEVTIQGTIDGDIECNSVTINKSGNVKGKVQTETMTVEGKVEGEININSILHIKSQGSVSGKVFYGDIQIDEGGKLLGEINFKEQVEKEEESKDWKAL